MAHLTHIPTAGLRIIDHEAIRSTNIVAFISPAGILNPQSGSCVGRGRPSAAVLKKEKVRREEKWRVDREKWREAGGHSPFDKGGVRGIFGKGG